MGAAECSAAELFDRRCRPSGVPVTMIWRRRIERQMDQQTRRLMLLFCCSVVTVLGVVACRVGGIVDPVKAPPGPLTSPTGQFNNITYAPRHLIFVPTSRVVGLPPGVVVSDDFVDPTVILPPKGAMGPVVEFKSSAGGYFSQPVQIELPLFERPSSALVTRMRAAYLTPHGWFSVAEPVEVPDRSSPVAVLKSHHLGMSTLGGWSAGQWHLGAWCIRLLPEPGLELTRDAETVSRVVILVHGVWADPESWDGFERHLAGGLPPDTLVIKMYCPPGNGLADSAKFFQSELNRLAAVNPKADVHIIAHSTGGLVARMALESQPRPAAHVVSLTMIGTPNGGSHCAAKPSQGNESHGTSLDHFLMELGALVRPLNQWMAAAAMFRDGAGRSLAELDPSGECIGNLNRGWKTPPAGIEYLCIAGNSGGNWRQLEGEERDLKLSELEQQGDQFVSCKNAGLVGEELLVFPYSHLRLHTTSEVANEVLRAMGASALSKGTAVLRGHTAFIESVVFSPDGKTIASASYDRSIRFWDTASGKRLNSIVRADEGYAGRVNSVVFSADGKSVICGGGGGAVRILDIATGKTLRMLSGHTGEVNCVALSPDGKTIASGSWDKTIRLWDADSGNLFRTLNAADWTIWSLAFSPDGTTIAAGSTSIKLWDIASGRELWDSGGKINSVVTLAFSPDGKSIAGSTEHDVVGLLDARTGRPLKSFKGHINSISSVAFSPDGKTIASASRDHTIRLWSTTTSTMLQTFEGHTGAVNSVAFSPDGTILLSGSSDDTVRLWRIGAEIPTPKPLGPLAEVFDVAWSPNGTMIATGSRDEVVRLWDPTSGRMLTGLEGDDNHVTKIAFSPDSKFIATWYFGFGRIIRLYHTETGAFARRLEGEVDYVERMVFGRDGTFIAASVGDKEIWIWDVATGKRTGSIGIGGEFAMANSFAFSPDGTLVAVASYDRTVRLWDARTGTLVRNMEQRKKDICHSVVFSPDGATIVCAGNSGVDAGGFFATWDVATGTLRRMILIPDASFTEVEFSADRKTLASATYQHPVQLWDVETGEVLRVLEGAFRCSAFSPDGKRIVCAGYRVGLWVWQLDQPSRPPQVIED